MRMHNDSSSAIHEIRMATGRFISQPINASDRRDRNFFLAYALLIWAVTIAGFGFEMAGKLADGTLRYPLIVHAHALAFVGWLALLTTQIVLIRRDDRSRHKRLGITAVAMIPLMAILAIATVIVTKTLKYGKPDISFPFMSIQFTNVIASTALLAAGALLRRSASEHKRLMLMGTLVLTEPGIRRIVSCLLNGNFHDGFWPFMFETYAGTIILMLGVGIYDWLTRHRLHPTYLVAFSWCLANQVVATWLYYQPWWSTYTTRLVAP